MSFSETVEKRFVCSSTSSHENEVTTSTSSVINKQKKLSKVINNQRGICLARQVSHTRSVGWEERRATIFCSVLFDFLCLLFERASKRVRSMSFNKNRVCLSVSLEHCWCCCCYIQIVTKEQRFRATGNHSRTNILSDLVQKQLAPTPRRHQNKINWPGVKLWLTKCFCFPGSLSHNCANTIFSSVLLEMPVR